MTRRRIILLGIIIIIIGGVGGAAYLVRRNNLLEKINLAVTLALNPSKPPDNFYLQSLILNLYEPTSLTFGPDGQMFITERAGKVELVEAGSTQVRREPVLELQNINTAQGERGMVGFVLDPDFKTNHYYYVFYTADSPLHDRISRFTLNDDSTTDLTSEKVIWEDLVVADFWHHGGQLAFGKDGRLYAAVGFHSDPTEGTQNVSQRLDTYHGKILRLNSDGTVPTDNPFYDGDGPNLDAIWAMGLRNPFRFSIDPVTDIMYIADVGGNDKNSIEELNIGKAGANYGWPICEGVCDKEGITNPIFTYPHNGRDASIIGGLVYRASLFPQEYQGSYFFADYAQHWIKRLTFDAAGKPTESAFLPTNGVNDQPYGDIVDLETGPDGALYYVDIALDNYGNHLGPGSVRRISYSANNHPPVISKAVANVTTGPKAPLAIDFSSAATDSDNNTLTYSWDFGDHTTGDQASMTHNYEKAGEYSARLTVSDGKTVALSDPIAIVIGTPPMVTITEPKDKATFKAGDVISMKGSATDDGALTADSYSWKTIFHHLDHVHPGSAGQFGDSATFTVPTTGHDFSEETWYEIVLTVTDVDGLISTASVSIYPDKITQTFQSDPPGLSLGYNESGTIETPFIRPALIGFDNILSAPPEQTLNGVKYIFDSWSDGGEATHTVTTGDSDQTYMAKYKLAQ